MCMYMSISVEYIYIYMYVYNIFVSLSLSLFVCGRPSIPTSRPSKRHNDLLLRFVNSGPVAAAPRSFQSHGSPEVGIPGSPCVYIMVLIFL